MTVSVAAYDFAQNRLSDQEPDIHSKSAWEAHDARVRRYAEAVQKAVEDVAEDDAREAEEDRQQSEEMQALRGYTDAERERI